VHFAGNLIFVALIPILAFIFVKDGPRIEEALERELRPGALGLLCLGHLVWIAVFVVCYRVFQDYVLAPYLMGGGIGVHPLLVIFGLLAGEQLGGIAGVFLSIPVIAGLAIVARHVRGKDAGQALQS
jgi:predicted PurR-regulated permease PerM